MGLKRFWHRIYADFFMPSRLPEYQALLELALRQGYQVHSIASFWEAVKQGKSPGDRSLILRHDVDTDVDTARHQFAIEQSLGLRASYYFRLSTLDVPFMEAIARGGSEASYHYEELATVAKAKGLRTRSQVEAHLDQIRSLFAQNLTDLRLVTGLPMRIVASHGDFANRLLGMPNWELLTPQLRTDLGIELEVYDDVINRHVTSRHSDGPYPKFWAPGPPGPALESGEPVVYVLTHPRHWSTAPLENLRDDLCRAWEGWRYPAR